MDIYIYKTTNKIDSLDVAPDFGGGKFAVDDDGAARGEPVGVGF
jgi:hypothetical protein